MIKRIKFIVIMDIHEETLKIARNLIKKDPSLTDWVISKFPELKESGDEDERIRKELIRAFKSLNTIKVWNGIERTEILAWLEKQGEHANFRNKIQVGDKVTRNEDGVLVNLSQLNRVAKKDEKQGKQKPAWSEEDDKIIKEIINDIECARAINYHAPKEDYEFRENWLKSLKDKIQSQLKQEWKQENTGDLTDFENAMMHIGNSFFGNNAGLDPNDTDAIKKQANLLLELVQKQEWSEEDRKIIIELIGIFESAIDGGHVTFPYRLIKDYIRVLKSCLPQNIWKPSDEQIKALNYVVNLMASSERPTENDLYYNILKSLRQQLKKLREE